ncbi:FHA domain-containing protein [Antribacter sp. KLBMP9083]|uniref:FHA domain-containing protein n=1 Tax=Antribacter soli TaxID=2910976 RepID=A0AA41QHM2_9MICO|nr:FHA domain-containing protein [Antribacter soli]MCF4122826.1 FHA domain-containing protein [Antribacter soli]
MTVQYTTGAACAVVRGDALVVLPGSRPDDVPARLWAELAAPGAGVAEALGVLTSLGGGLKDVPQFAVLAVTEAGSAAAPAPGTAHVAVRGTGVTVTVQTTTGPVSVDGSDVISWSERVVSGVTAFDVTVSGAFAAPGLPVDSGVVLVGAVRREVVPGAMSSAAGDASELDESTVHGVLDGLPRFAPAPSPAAVAAAAAASAGGAFARASEETLAPEFDGPSAAVGGAVPAHTGVPAGEPVPAAAGSPEATQLGGGDDDYLHLWGETVMRRVEDAAVRPVEAEEGEEEAEAAPAAAPAAEPVAAPAPAPAPAVPGPAAEEEGGLISEVPGLVTSLPRLWTGASPAARNRAAQVDLAPGDAAAPPDPEPGLEAPEGGLDHDGHTVMSSAIADLRAAAGLGEAPKFTAPPAPGAQQILAQTCTNGHPNPPSRGTCRTCGASLDGDAHLAARPSLGRVVVTGGTATSGAVGARGSQVVELDRPVIVGRRPRTPSASASDMPRLVTVSSPQQDISRSHVHVTLEDWHVLVADLATTNGTTLLRPGQPPRRLHPNEKELVADGDVVDLGDGVTLTFEGIW